VTPSAAAAAPVEEVGTRSTSTTSAMKLTALDLDDVGHESVACAMRSNTVSLPACLRPFSPMSTVTVPPS
jgi:hypothetical protein